MAAKRGEYLLVAGLDFGTTFSGYAFSFVNDPEKILCNRSWGESFGFQSYKTPTSILTNGAGEFVAMGYDAEHKYTEELEEAGSAVDLHLYRHFKMMLHKSRDVSLRSVVTSEDGTITPAVDIFGYAIAFLRNHIIDAIKAENVTEPDPSEILWVITVPAIWSEQSKKFMREAANRGGCIVNNDKNLILALEPEAASLICRRHKFAAYKGGDVSFPPDTKYLVLDCGGGTVDITAHKTLKEDTIEELLPASGGPWGGMYVDRQFANLLEEIFGKDFLNKYRSFHPQGWLQLMTSFETIKKPFNAADKSVLRVGLPWSFGDLHTETKGGKSIKDSIKSYDNPEISFTAGSLVLKENVAKSLFAPVFDQIISHVRVLLKHPKLEDCRYILMVGGFSESRLLQDEVKRIFQKNGTKVLIPSEAQLAVLKGAVLFGHFPNEITTRIARKTYAFKTASYFDSTIHDLSKSYTDEDGKTRCRNIFHTLIKQGDTITTGKEFKKTVYPQSKDCSHSVTTIMQKDGQPNKPVQYTDSPEVQTIGKVKINFDQCEQRRQNKIILTFIFGSTEIYVTATHEATGKEVSTSLEFLSEPSLD